MNGHNQFYLAVHNHAKNTRISPTLLENHPACTRLTPLYFLQQQVFRSSRPFHPPSSRMYLSIYSHTLSTFALCRRHRVLDYTLTLSRFIVQAMAVTPGPAHYCRG